jgi:hypothetical protein
MNFPPAALESPPLYAIAGRFLRVPDTGHLQAQVGLANGPFTILVTVCGHVFPTGLMFKETVPVVEDGTVSFPRLTTCRKIPIDKKAKQLTGRAGPYTFEVCLMAGDIPLIQPISFQVKTTINQLPKEAQEWRSAATKTQRRARPRAPRRSVWETSPKLKAILGGVKPSKRNRFKAETYKQTVRMNRFLALRHGRIGISVEYRFTGAEPGSARLKGRVCTGVVRRWYEKEMGIRGVVDVCFEEQGVILKEHPIRKCSIIEWLPEREITVPSHMR